MAWGEPTPCPELGEGWLRFSKPRGSGERSERADFQWVSPGGQKFRSLKAAQEAAAGGAPGGGAGAASSGKGGKAKKAKTAPKGLKVPYRRPGFAEAQAAAAAAAHAAQLHGAAMPGAMHSAVLPMHPAAMQAAAQTDPRASPSPNPNPHPNRAPTVTRTRTRTRTSRYAGA